jgi:hypothetical protein
MDRHDQIEIFVCSCFSARSYVPDTYDLSSAGKIIDSTGKNKRRN